MSKRELFIVPLCEGAILAIAAVMGWMVHKPFLFASLGPTAYELIETPERPSARAYNIIVGHLAGVLSGFAAVYCCHALNTQGISSGTVVGPRIGAATLAAALTVLITLLLHATQPAAVSTTLLIALGTLQTWQDGFVIMSAVLVVLLCGSPLRRWRLREKSGNTSH